MRTPYRALTNRVLSKLPAILTFALCVAGCAPNSAQNALPRGDNSNLLLGNPSRAGRDANNYLVEREAHAMSYNKSNGTPNWVAWYLHPNHLGRASRSDFLPDPLLPPDMRIRPTDYRGSGYDRGHVCPSGDRTRDPQLNQQTFVMSNMLPQAPALNQHVWRTLEEYERTLAKDGNELYILAGGVGSVERIGRGKVNVPSVCWKIILVLPRGNNDLSRITADTRVIAVSMPNRNRDEIKNSRWAQWTTSVAQLEKTTGYDFLSALPDNIERALEQTIDSGRAGAGPKTTRTTPGNTPQTVSPPTAAPLSASVMVWVNTGSGVYHMPGMKYYGKTKHGEYMTEAQARARGYRAAQR